jgi:hypothetical protein
MTLAKSGREPRSIVDELAEDMIEVGPKVGEAGRALAETLSRRF